MTDEVTVQPTHSLFGKRIELSGAEMAKALAITAADNSSRSPSQSKLNERLSRTSFRSIDTPAEAHA